MCRYSTCSLMQRTGIPFPRRVVIDPRKPPELKRRLYELVILFGIGVADQ